MKESILLGMNMCSVDAAFGKTVSLLVLFPWDLNKFGLMFAYPFPYLLQVFLHPFTFALVVTVHLTCDH